MIDSIREQDFHISEREVGYRKIRGNDFDPANEFSFFQGVISHPDEITRLRLYLLNEEELDYFHETGDLPDGWLTQISQLDEDDHHTERQIFLTRRGLPLEESNEELHPEADDTYASFRMSPEHFFYEPARFSEEERERQYLAARGYLVPIREQILALRKKTYIAAAVVISSSALLGANGNANQDLVAGTFVGGSAAVAIGARGRWRKKKEELLEKSKVLEVIVQQFELDHLGRDDQKFYDEHKIPVDVRTHTPDPYIHNTLYQESEPQTTAEKVVNRVADGVEYSAVLIRDLLF